MKEQLFLKIKIIKVMLLFAIMIPLACTSATKTIVANTELVSGPLVTAQVNTQQSGDTLVYQQDSTALSQDPMLTQEAPLPPPQESLPPDTIIPVKLIREELYTLGKPEPITFSEIWAYVQAGEESALDPSWPISDVALFSASISSTGKLRGVPNRNKLAHFKGKVHLTIVELSNYALTHFCLSPEFTLRSKLIEQIVQAAKPYDGINIDFEAVLTEDKEYFISFLKALKTRIGKKTLSVALPARTKKENEAYDYERIAAVADRIIVMAYDEHWSGSQPGSIASLQWCERVADYALKSIGGKKLVMGLPFYGRAWGEINPSRAYRFSSLSKLMEEKGIQETRRVDGSVYFEYNELIKVQVYYEDHRSIHQRAALYYNQGVNSIAFWRIGQEDQEIWKFLFLKKR
ncbi:glycosyl hydrolase family 18 protein [Gracilinema caldarium]|uniref:glycosyl hydrolase family 18 protein n=1 Tax=Gracilinema caldarium TaxID=215591 RepID=UPI0026F0D1E7|nr:glycosyl hydrolase family 18 protein [Gracilinema caldarium]